MTRLAFLLIWISFAAVLFLLMAIAWRGRVRRDARFAQPVRDLAGEVVAIFAHASYVSTTPIGAPLERIAIPGLSFKGWADITVRRDGIAIAVTGERPVEIGREQLRGTDTASRRVGKVVERDGLSLLRWEADGREVESSFRFGSPSEQLRFAEAVAEITDLNTTTTQESANR